MNKRLETLIAGQLKFHAEDDDQLGRGEYDVFGVRPGESDDEFLVDAGWPGAGDYETFKVKVTRETR